MDALIEKIKALKARIVTGRRAEFAQGLEQLHAELGVLMDQITRLSAVAEERRTEKSENKD